ncbi:MAG: hypothetical protein ACO3CD_04130 [Candidatus Nanopelagicaceae bacterium]
MPTNDYTSPGNYSWTTPFATRNVTATCIGGGAAGFKDCTADDKGGGGGGGGFARGTRTVGPGVTMSITVGDGGERPGCNSRPNSANGGTSVVSGGPLVVRATGGECGRDDAGGGGGGAGDSGDVTRSGGTGADDDDGQDGGSSGTASQSGNSRGGCGNATGGRGTSLDGGGVGCPGGRSGSDYGGGGAGNDGGEPGRGGRGAVRIEWDYYAPVINTFYGSTQDSGTGTPSSTVTLTWGTSYANNVSINNGVGSGLAATDSKTFSSGLQSVAGSNSPATRTYTLTASGPGGSTTATATVYVYNDNTPSNSWSTSFTNLEPNTQVTVTLGTLSGVDMPTLISCSSGSQVGSSSGGFSNSRTFSNGNTVQLRTTTLGFNTDISGLSSTATFGKTNTKTVTVSHPGGSFDVTIQTRAPRIKEDFDYANNLNKYPYEDIDLIANSPTQYLTSASVDVDDIEIDMEMKVDRADAQVSINNGPWQNVRGI